MNPSANGWIKKLLKELSTKDTLFNLNEETFYDALRSSGFIYGSNFEVVCNHISNKDLTEDELCKINLCLALLYTHKNSSSEVPFVESVITFYTEINELKTSYFLGFLGEKKANEQLEKIIHKRILLDDNFITKNFNYFIINAFLYIDILTYQEFLKKESIAFNYIKKLEASIETISLNVLNSKESKNKYDESLIKLFEASLRYQSNSPLTFPQALTHINSTLEKYYILDLACMASWSDKTIDKNEHGFLIQLGNKLHIEKNYVNNSIHSVTDFFIAHKDHIALLSSTNMVQSFYNNSSKMVKRLITRNSKRLYQELKDSKELMVLLTQSTKRDLNNEEQKKMQEQLLDVFKSIPSLAIFLLPGGAILLPLVVKFIPKLLPSAFDENRVED
jgi:hypothetical protein